MKIILIIQNIYKKINKCPFCELNFYCDKNKLIAAMIDTSARKSS